MAPLPVALLPILALLCLSGGTQSASLGTIMDGTGRILPSTTVGSIVTIVTSPGVPSILVENGNDESDDMIAVDLNGRLVCSGCTLGSSSGRTAAANGLAVCGAVSQVVILEGITVGDIQAGLRHTRHARTLTTLFQARDATVVVVLPVADATPSDEASVVAQVKALSAAAPNLDIDVRVVSTVPSEILSVATEAAQSAEASSESVSSTLQAAWRHIQESSSRGKSVDAPHMVEATYAVSTSALRHTRAVLDRVSAWNNRIARGLLVDHFGSDAANVQRLVTLFDTETLQAAGLPTVSNYRKERRLQLQQTIDTAIQQAFAGQVANLEKRTLKRFTTELLKTIGLTQESVETMTGHNAATLRKEVLLFETAMEQLQVPSLGLTKEKASRDVSSKLNDALDAFPDSPAAKLKRTRSIHKVVNKEKSPGQRSVSFGLDVVAMLRPDGFGSLQGFAGYQLPGGNSITFGVHNDADDPQVISQFGGVRPPLLRVQPKLRVEVEM